MSDLSNDPPIAEEPVDNEEKTSSLSMVVTMTLLIAGFILASTMMLHYGSKRVGKDGISKPASFDVTSILEKGKSYKQQLSQPKPKDSTPEVQAETEGRDVQETVQPAPAKSSGFFGLRSDKVKWPRLKLTGFGSATDGEGGFAIINGKQVHPGQLISGKVLVKEIQYQRVIVEYQGETKTLTVDLQD